jgi:hypothetical protein
VGNFIRKQDFIDLIEEVYKAGINKKLIANCGIPKTRLPRYSLLFKDF